MMSLPWKQVRRPTPGKERVGRREIIRNTNSYQMVKITKAYCQGDLVTITTYQENLPNISNSDPLDNATQNIGENPHIETPKANINKSLAKIFGRERRKQFVRYLRTRDRIPCVQDILEKYVPSAI